MYVSIVCIWYCVLWVSQQLLVANLVELNRAPCQSCAPVKGSLEAGGRLRHSRGQPLGRDCHLTLIEQPSHRGQDAGRWCKVGAHQVHTSNNPILPDLEMDPTCVGLCVQCWNVRAYSNGPFGAKELQEEHCRLLSTVVLI